MDVQILSTEIIKPSSPTPHHLRHFKPSFLDQTSAPFYIPLTLFYNTKFDLGDDSQIHIHLKKSLSETLNIFYPLAGRIQDMFTILCNDDGVCYTEAKANFTLSEFLHRPDLNLLNKFLPRRTNSLETGIDFQFSVQISVFSCGGFVIGACAFHRIVDVATMASFLKTWAGYCGPTRYEPVGKPDLALDLGSSLFPPLSSLPADYLTNHTSFYFPGGNFSSLTRRFVFNSSAIAALRKKATSAAVPRPSRVEVLTGFISERLMAGLKKLASEPPPPAMTVTHAVNIRKRIEPPLPENAFGNFTWFAAAFYSPSDEVGLPDYVETLRESLDGINGENLKEMEPESVVRSLSTNMRMLSDSESNGQLRVYKFSSWCNMGFYDLDFGWGRPVWVAHMGDAGDSRTKHQLMFLDGTNEGEIELWVLFGEDDMWMLENDDEFLAFARPNPSIHTWDVQSF
ncbi:hypothetical protein OROMI_027221 [Orobanche minor]